MTERDKIIGKIKNSAAIEAYIASHYPELGDLKTRDRNSGKGRLQDHELADYYHGTNAGRNAELNRGVGGEEARKALR